MGDEPLASSSDVVFHLLALEGADGSPAGARVGVSIGMREVVVCGDEWALLPCGVSERANRECGGVRGGCMAAGPPLPDCAEE